MALHQNLTGSDLHQPKGAAAASANTTIIADGSGSTSWAKIASTNINTSSIKNINKFYLTTQFSDISTADFILVPCPTACTFVSATIIIQNAITAADSIVTFTNSTGPTSIGTLTITNSGSAEGTRYTFTASSNNTMTAGSYLKIATDGASSTAAKATVFLNFTLTQQVYKLAKLTLNDLSSLTNQASAIALINANNTLCETALENTVSLDGTAPNSMEADFDMNSNRILNLPEPGSDLEPVRLIDLTNALTGNEDSSFDLDNLDDVTITSPSDNQFLRYDGSGWVNETVTVTEELNDLSDVIITSPSDNQFLRNNGTDWVNETVTITDLGTIVDLGGAPDTVDFIVKSVPPTTTLSNYWTATDTASVTWDFDTAHQAKPVRAALTGAVTAPEGSNTTTIAVLPVTFVIACSDETTALSAGTAKTTFRMPHAMTVTGVRASLTTTQASGNIFTVDINEAVTSILSTKLTIDNAETTSTTAATPAVISDATLADDASITVDIDQIGDGTAKGLKVVLIGTRP